MADPAAVLELQEHMTPGRPDGVGDAAPARNVLGAVDTGDIGVGLTHLVRGGGLGDDQARAGPLGVIGRHQVRRGAVRARAVARQGGHHQAVR
jgi:hypothetical protein